MGEVKYRTVNTDQGNIVIRVFNGTMSKTDIVDSFKYMIDNELLTNNSKGLITDISASIIDIDMVDLENMINFISLNDILSKIKLAVVATTPEGTLLPTLANFKIGDRLVPFSSVESAREWVEAC